MKCFIHAGTHKTGTTALQALLTACEKYPLNERLFVPRCGRLPPELSGGGAGHHNIAWELNGDLRFRPEYGTLAETLEEIDVRRARVVVLSSEDFEYLHMRPDALARLVAALSAIRYEAHALLYLRPRAEYAESLYAELVKHGLSCDFSAFTERILADGVFTFGTNWAFRFEYAVLADRFAAAFGRDCLTLRPYPAGQEPAVLMRDFLAAVTGETGEAALELPEIGRPNGSLSLLAVLDALYANASKKRSLEPGPAAFVAEALSGDAQAMSAEKFAALDQADVERFRERFREDDERLASLYDIRLSDDAARRHRKGDVQKRLMAVASQRWGFSGNIDMEEARRRLQEREDAKEEDLAGLLRGGKEEREAALTLLLRTQVRRAAELAGELARCQTYASEPGLRTLQTLGELSDDVGPLIEAHKNIGMHYAQAGDFEESMRYLQSVASRAGSVGGLYDARSHAALAYLCDKEIDTALADLAGHFRPLHAVPVEPLPIRVTLFVAALIDENSPSVAALTIARGLRERGYEVNLVSSEFADSMGSRVLERCREEGLDVALAPREGSFRGRVEAILSIFHERPTHAVLYIGTQMDNVMKVVSEVSVSPAQLFLNIGQEQHCGKFVFVLQTLSEEQEHVTYWPGRSKYIGGFVALQQEIEKAVPFDRTSFKLSADALVLGTFGRLQKCSSAYVLAVEAILQAEPRAVLLLAGPGSHEETMFLRAVVAQKGLRERVHLLGPRQGDVPRLLKTLDLYLDTFPRPGGQSILEAMCAEVPVVAMRRTRDKAIDALGVGPTSSTVETLLPPEAELAEAEDVAGYARIALEYLRDPAKRRRVGAALRDFTRTRHERTGWFDRLEYYVREAVAAHCPAAVTEAITVSAS